MRPNHIRLFLSSPGDVPEERELVHQTVEILQTSAGLRGRITIDVIAWDRPGSPPMEANLTPQEAIRRGLPMPSECDIVVVVFWSRIGTPLELDGKQYDSGTMYEYLDALEAASASGKPRILIYRRTQEPIIGVRDPNRHEKLDQFDRVERFFESFADAETGALKGFYNGYETPDDFRQQFEQHLRYLLLELVSLDDHKQDLLTTSTTLPLEPTFEGDPFPGLKAFTPDDAPIFFGRGREIDALATRLTNAKNGFIAVVGASGSGKSSLVGAGLVPRLITIYGEDHLVLLYFTPDEISSGDPFVSLIAALKRDFPSIDTRRWAKLLRDDRRSFVELVPLLLQDKPEDAQLLMFIDQFEELFTTVREEYIEPLLDLIDTATQLDNVQVVITMRGDFYGDAIEYQRIASLLKDSTYPLAAPGSGALLEMITRPAERAGVSFEPDLVNRILNDAGTEPGALALIAFALRELYKACEETRILTHEAYDALGEVKGAVSQRSEAVFSQLSEAAQNALQRVFRELISMNDDGTATRKRAPIYRFSNIEGAQELIQELVDARLLISSGENVQQPYIEVAHEALLRSWQRLVEWIEHARDDLRLLRQVRLAAEEWNQNQQREDFRWSQERLEPVYQMLENLNVDLTLEPQLKAFIRPETEYLVTKFRQTDIRQAQRYGVIERLLQIGRSGIPALIQLLEDVPRDFTRLNRVENNPNNPDIIAEIYHALVKYPSVSVSELIKVVATPPDETSETKAEQHKKRRLIALHTLATLYPRKAPELARLRSTIHSISSQSSDESKVASPQQIKPSVLKLEARKSINHQDLDIEVPPLESRTYDLGLYTFEKDQASPSRFDKDTSIKYFSVSDDHILATIIDCLDDADSKIREHAVYLLGDICRNESLGKEVEQGIIERLTDRDSIVRFAALRVVTRLNIIEANATIVTLFEESVQKNIWLLDRNSDLDLLLLEVVNHLSLISALPALLNLISRHGSFRNDAREPMALYVINNLIVKHADKPVNLPEAPEVYLRQLSETLTKIIDDNSSSDDWQLRKLALTMLVELGLKEMAEPVIRRLFRVENNPNIVKDLPIFAVRLSLPDAGALLIDSLNEEYDSVKQALICLGYAPDHKTDKVHSFVTQCLYHKNTQVRAEACTFIKRSFLPDEVSEDVEKRLIALLDDTSAEVRSAAALAIGQLGLMNATAALIPLLRDSDIRNRVIEAICQLKNPELLALLERAEHKADGLLVSVIQQLRHDLLDSVISPSALEAILKGAKDVNDRRVILEHLGNVEFTPSQGSYYNDKSKPKDKIASQFAVIVRSIPLLPDVLHIDALVTAGELVVHLEDSYLANQKYHDIAIESLFQSIQLCIEMGLPIEIQLQLLDFFYRVSLKKRAQISDPFSGTESFTPIFYDELYTEAVELVREKKTASVSMLQRHFRIGYTRAVRLIDEMQNSGIIASVKGGNTFMVLDPKRAIPPITATAVETTPAFTPPQLKHPDLTERHMVSIPNYQRIVDNIASSDSSLTNPAGGLKSFGRRSSSKRDDKKVSS